MNKQLIEKYQEEVWNKRNLDAVDELFAPDAKVHSALGKDFSSPSGMKKVIKVWLDRFPELHVEMLHLIEVRDLVVAHWQASAPGVFYQGATFYRFENDQVKEYWAYTDSLV